MADFNMAGGQTGGGSSMSGFDITGIGSIIGGSVDAANALLGTSGSSSGNTSGHTESDVDRFIKQMTNQLSTMSQQSTTTSEQQSSLSQLQTMLQQLSQATSQQTAQQGTTTNLAQPQQQAVANLITQLTGQLTGQLPSQVDYAGTRDAAAQKVLESGIGNVISSASNARAYDSTSQATAAERLASRATVEGATVATQAKLQEQNQLATAIQNLFGILKGATQQTSQVGNTTGTNTQTNTGTNTNTQSGTQTGTSNTNASGQTNTNTNQTVNENTSTVTDSSQSTKGTTGTDGLLDKLGGALGF